MNISIRISLNWIANANDANWNSSTQIVGVPLADRRVSPRRSPRAQLRRLMPGYIRLVFARDPPHRRPPPRRGEAPPGFDPGGCGAARTARAGREAAVGQVHQLCSCTGDAGAVGLQGVRGLFCRCGAEGWGVSFRTECIGDATLVLGDCRDVLPTIGHVDAVVTDPPYGIGEAAGKNASRGNLAHAKDYGDARWDDEPIDAELLKLVLSVSKWQVIFGGNYYALPATSCWLVWDKENTGDFADCELAWTNLPKAVRRLRFMWNGMLRAHGEPRGDHPTQKPIGVMQWCIGQVPPPNNTILDPFMGSGTTGVACAKLGRRFIGIEIDETYFNTAVRRIEAAYAQPDMFVQTTRAPAAEQPDMLA